MPELRYYTIVQEREVKVSATKPIDALVLADRVLSGTMKPEDQINVQQRPRELSLNIREDR
jgi:hypothetical protein